MVQWVATGGWFWIVTAVFLLGMVVLAWMNER